MSERQFGRTDASKTPSQADFARVKANMLDRLWNIFGEPKALDLESFANEYVKALHRFDAQQLSEGCDELFRTMKFTKWPTPSECIAACNTAAKAIYRMQNKRHPTASPGASRSRVQSFNILTVNDLQFGHWIVHFRESGRNDIADEAIVAGSIATWSRWPTPGVEDFIAIGPFQTKQPAHPDGATVVIAGNGERIR